MKELTPGEFDVCLLAPFRRRGPGRLQCAHHASWRSCRASAESTIRDGTDVVATRQAGCTMSCGCACTGPPPDASPVCKTRQHRRGYCCPKSSGRCLRRPLRGGGGAGSRSHAERSTPWQHGERDAPSRPSRQLHSSPPSGGHAPAPRCFAGDDVRSWRASNSSARPHGRCVPACACGRYASWAGFNRRRMGSRSCRHAQERPWLRRARHPGCGCSSQLRRTGSPRRLRR